MKVLKHPVFLLMCSIALFIYVAKLSNIILPTWLRFYANDFLCMPIILSVCLASIRYWKKNINLYIPGYVVFLVTAYYNFHFEWLAPQLFGRYTSDWVDVLLYAFGALLFYVFQKRLF